MTVWSDALDMVTVRMKIGIVPQFVVYQKAVKGCCCEKGGERDRRFPVVVEPVLLEERVSVAIW